MFDYFHNIFATIVPIPISCQASHYCSLQSLQLGKTDKCFFSSRVDPSNTVEDIQQG